MARRGKLGTPSSEIPQMPNWAPSGSMDAHELESIQKGVQSESLDERANEMIDLEQEALGFQAQADTRVIDGASDGESAPPPNRLCGTNPNA